MRLDRALVLAPAVLVTFYMAVAQAGAGLSFFGPSAYLSAADSPFDLSASFTCLEDLEDGAFNVPGVTGNGTRTAPSGITDSVDGDDGNVDGSGTAGNSYFGNGPTGITFTFDPAAPLGLPTKAGMVWTDGMGSITFEAFGPDGGSLGTIGPSIHADGGINGTTAEDRFYGVENTGGGISAIKLSNTSGGIEVDHLQYDNCATAATSTTLPTATTTTTSSVTTTSTTLPTGCPGVPVAPTLASLNCRLADLLLAVQGEPALGVFQSKLATLVTIAKMRKEEAEQLCAAGNTKRARKRLGRAVRLLIRFSHRLRGSKAHSRIEAGVREPLLQAADAIRADARTLKGTLACPQAGASISPG